MKWVKKEADQRVPIKSWCDFVEDGALKQAFNLSRHPSVFKHVALMPDCHRGYGMPIGGVIACKMAVIPNAVGVDIGCGMCAVKTDFQADDITEEAIKRIMGKVREKVPVGFNHNKEVQEWSGFEKAPEISIISQQLPSARKQLGTLGGGNHFIEIQKGDDGVLWLMIHSGSRNFGYKIANKYHETALKLCRRWFSDIPDEDLAFLPMESKEATEYFDCMNFALQFAKENRQRMMEHFKEAVHDVLGCYFREEEINIHHNYAAWENHFKQNVIIHRKGATSARKGQKGIIPGSMGTPSYIVEGLGNPESFTSCSHGAGRKMGRMEASRRLSKEECDKAMEGIVFGRWGRDRKGNPDFGEAPQAYKDIEDVIGSELDLIKPIVKLQPLGVIKG